MWKKIEGFNENYEVNEKGQIQSCFPYKKPRILKQILKGGGYLTVNLQSKNRIIQARVHRIVATAFIANPENKSQVNHKDGNKLNNCASNLEWVTASENIKHSFSVLGKTPPNKGRIGAKHYSAKKVCQYGLDGKFIRQWDCISDAARAVQCNPCQIMNNVKGRTRTCHGYMWRYEKADEIDTLPVTSRKTHKRTGFT